MWKQEEGCRMKYKAKGLKWRMSLDKNCKQILFKALLSNPELICVWTLTLSENTHI